MLTLRDGISMQAFLEAVRQCEGDICFESPEHDFFNLKSQFSQYVFAAAALKPSFQINGTVTCRNPKDVQKLENFLQK